MSNKISVIINDSINTKSKLLNDDFYNTIEDVVNLCISAFEINGKVLFCGNGGSAADAQHIAAELSGRFYFDREPLYAEALHVNSSYLTAVANDYGYEMVYERMIKAMGSKGDVLFAISTSGNSENVLRAAKAAKEIGMYVVGMFGQSNGQIGYYCDYVFNIDSKLTPRIQESHILIGHILCELIESKYFSGRDNNN